VTYITFGRGKGEGGTRSRFYNAPRVHPKRDVCHMLHCLIFSVIFLFSNWWWPTQLVAETCSCFQGFSQIYLCYDCHKHSFFYQLPSKPTENKLLSFFVASIGSCYWCKTINLKNSMYKLFTFSILTLCRPDGLLIKYTQLPGLLNVTWDPTSCIKLRINLKR
jgi:hypothetical protein